MPALRQSELLDYTVDLDLGSFDDAEDVLALMAALLLLASLTGVVYSVSLGIRLLSTQRYDRRRLRDLPLDGPAVALEQCETLKSR